MVEGHGRQQWAHTSLLAAIFANAHRDPRRTRPFRTDDFNPYASDENHEAIEVTPETIGQLKQAFIGHFANRKGP